MQEAPAIRTVTEPRLLDAVAAYFGRPSVSGPLEALRRRLPPSAGVLVAGGAIRNVIMEVLHGAAPPTGDVDLFIGGLAPGFPLAQALAGERVAPTELAGLRWDPAPGGPAFDLCLLPDFLVIARFRLAPTADNLLSGIDLTCNAAVLDLRRGTLTEKGCTAAVAARIIDFNSPLVPDKGLIAYRALLMGHKTGFAFARGVYRFLRNRLDLDALNRVKGMLTAKAGKEVAGKVMGGYDTLCRHPSYEAYRSAVRSGAA